MDRNRNSVPVEGESTLGRQCARAGSIYWRPLGPITEVTLYPLRFGATRLVFGRRDRDYWEIGYDYPDYTSGMEAAEEWDGHADPGHGWINSRKMTNQRRIEDEF